MKNIFDNVDGFQLDKGNLDKNWLKHHVLHIECEQIFFNEPLIVADDLKYSLNEKRWYALGRTESDRRLFVVFKIRKNRIRAISASDMKKKKEENTMKKLKNIPKFSTEQEEREFWSKNDSTDYLDWKNAKKVSFPNLKLSTKTISLRIPEYLLNDIKLMANKRDVPYQSLIKIILKERIDRELRHTA
jgi:uncharacterized DUF497 family protein